MKPETASHAILAGLVVLAGAVGFASWKLSILDTNIRTVIKHQERVMQKIVQNVIRKDTSTVTVTTVRLVDSDGTPEPVELWQQRHDAAVEQFRNT